MRLGIQSGIILAVALLSAGARSASAQDAVSAAEKAAQAEAETPTGRKYQEVVGAAFGRDQGKVIQACAREVKRPDLSDFRVFLRIDAAGQVQEALVKPGTNLAVCLQARLRAWKVAAPPRPDQWVSVQVRLQGRKGGPD